MKLLNLPLINFVIVELDKWKRRNRFRLPQDYFIEDDATSRHSCYLLGQQKKMIVGITINLFAC